MANLVTLASTTLSAPITSGARSLLLASRDGILVGRRLVIDGESMTVTDVTSLPSPWVMVNRGSDGTAGVAHANGATVWIAQAYQLYNSDPLGLPPTEVLVSPWINLSNGNIWWAQGDNVGIGNQSRWWQKQETTYSQGSLGIRTTSLDPTAGT